jgi:prepilin-type N-terminal cleavage/methylation domain-containing protein
MSSRAPSRRRRAQAGFSMVEMLMAAFILAVGILGISMLQTMSLKATRGSKSLTNAVQIADRVMDQIESEGRLSWLNLTATSFGPPGALPALLYIGRNTQYLGFSENVDAATGIVSVTPTSATPLAAKPALSPAVRYVVTVSEGTVGAGTSTVVAGGTGATTTYQVLVEFADEVNPTGTRIVRTVNISRSIVHG